jgi:hypothetical protein
MEFEAFDSFEAMMDAIDKARIAADGRVKDWQSAIKTGDHFAQATEYGFFIFGEVLDGGDEEFYTTPEGKNYRFCKAYSMACPEGECGDVHVSVITAIITKALFEIIRDKGWNIDLPE